MPAEQFQLSQQDDAVRNPLAVLNADPTYLPPGSRERIFLSTIPSLLRGNKAVLEDVRKNLSAMRASEEEPRHPTYAERKKQWQRFKDAGTDGDPAQDDADRFTVLDCYVHDFPESLRAREDLDTSWQQLYDQLSTLEQAMKDIGATLPPAPLPVVREDVQRRTRVVDLPTVADVDAFLKEIVKALPAAPQKKMRRKKPTAEEQARSHYAESAQLLETIGALKKYLGVLGDRLAMEDAYVGFDDGLKDAFRSISIDTHPDRNPGDTGAEQRFMEGNKAYDAVVNTTGDARKKLAHDLVYGDTTAWSPETLAVLEDVTLMFAPVFAQEAPPPPGDPCPACKGRGALQQQGVNDFIPVPRVCEECRGNGTVSAVVNELRRSLEEAVVARKKKRG